MNETDISNDFQLTNCKSIDKLHIYWKFQLHCLLKCIRNTQITFKSLFFFHSSFSKSQQSFFHNSFFLNYSIKNMYMNCLSISATLIFYVCVCLRFTQSQHFTTKNIVVSLDWKNWLHRNNDRKKRKFRLIKLRVEL